MRGVYDKRKVEIGRSYLVSLRGKGEAVVTIDASEPHGQVPNRLRFHYTDRHTGVRGSIVGQHLAVLGKVLGICGCGADVIVTREEDEWATDCEKCWIRSNGGEE
jgi:hypothetical protein